MLIIGIAGGSGSGKTTVVREIARRMSPHEHVTVIPQDSYYKDQGHLSMEERQALNFDHPDSIDWDLLVQQLRELKAGKAIDQPTYSYITCTRQEETVHVEPSDIIIVEGILIFTCKELMDELDIKVFVDADDDDRLMRVITRDIVERGKNVEWVIDRYTKTVKPMYLQFIAPSKRYADIIVPQGGHNKVAINVLLSGIRKMAKEKEQE
ncbi:MAG: uridine kinase [Bacteroidales bacterium]|jgi:uridine kinase|nr:uridine kinase [Bacteroidales bacterium]MBQ1680369.1 uridine kinase [Bacteroidales bacterium]MBQ1831959.1 uridine kinase [Bacteroidales bacterium]MBQ4221357.1 uridine kinase [Bacteroidales bacterium]MBQ5435477.1 uridine kinase [Bacteroidales bacterium]